MHRKIAITGGTGCLGYQLVKELSENGFAVKVLSRRAPLQKNQKIKHIKYIHGDLNSVCALESLCRDCEVVFHFAGAVHGNSKRETNPQSIFKVNVDGTRNLVNAAQRQGIRRIVFSSTVGVYGKIGNFHGSEQSVCNPLTTYSESKLGAERIVLEAHKDGGPNGTVLRFPVAYGPKDRGNVRRLILAVKNKKFICFGDGKNRRSMISSKNAAVAAIKAANSEMAANEIFCITDDIDYQFNNLISEICRALNTEWRPHHLPVRWAKWIGRMGDAFKGGFKLPFPVDTETISKLSSSLTFSCKKAKECFGYSPVETLNEGVQEEVAWMNMNSSNV